MTTALYIFWFLLPAIFFVVGLWASLEKIGGRQKRENPQDFFGQGLFVLVCVIISVVIDQFLLAEYLVPLLPDWLPLGFLQIALLPFVLYVAAITFGPSTVVRITKAPHPSEQRAKRLFQRHLKKKK